MSRALGTVEEPGVGVSCILFASCTSGSPRCSGFSPPTQTTLVEADVRCLELQAAQVESKKPDPPPARAALHDLSNFPPLGGEPQRATGKQAIRAAIKHTTATSAAAHDGAGAAANAPEATDAATGAVQLYHCPWTLYPLDLNAADTTSVLVQAQNRRCSSCLKPSAPTQYCQRLSPMACLLCCSMCLPPEQATSITYSMPSCQPRLRDFR